MDEKGFTLVELIVVAAVISILAAIAIGRMGAFADSSRAEAVEAEHRMLISAIQMWQSERPEIDNMPSDFTEISRFVSGGLDATATQLSVSKTGTPAHVLIDSKLVSTYDSNNTWTYVP